MKNYTLIVSESAISDLREIAVYVAGLYHSDSGHKYVNRILGQLAGLSYTADIIQFSRRKTVKRIHPHAKTLSVVNRRWTIVFHTAEKYVVIDRILPSKMVTD